MYHMQIDIIRSNVRQLMARDSISSETALAKKAGVDQKTINNLLALDTLPNPTMKVLDAIAKSFRVAPWMLWVKDFPYDALGASEPLNAVTRSGYRLLKVFESLNDEDRKAILNFAEFQISGTAPTQARQIHEVRAQYKAAPLPAGSPYPYKKCSEDFD